MPDLDIATLILAEHEAFRRDFARLRALSGEELARAWDELAAALEVHAAGEEAVLYPHVVRDVPEGEAETEHALRDHAEIREAVRQCAGPEVGSGAWWAAVEAAQEANAEHLAEEEADVLPPLKDSLDAGTREELGVQWLAFRDEHAGARGLPEEPDDPQAYVEEHRDA